MTRHGWPMENVLAQIDRICLLGSQHIIPFILPYGIVYVCECVSAIR